MTGEVNQPETEQPQVSEAAAGEPSPEPEQMPANRKPISLRGRSLPACQAAPEGGTTTAEGSEAGPRDG